MKTMIKLTLVTLALGVSASVVHAQNGPQNQNGNDFGGPPRGHRPSPPAIVAAVDANHDGVIDADEMTNAASALSALDKNGDGVLTPDEFVGRRPQRPDDSSRPADGGFDGPPGGFPPGPPPGRD